MPVKTLCKQSTLSPVWGNSCFPPPASDRAWGALIILLLHQVHPSSFPARYVPHVVRCHYQRGSVRSPWARAVRDPQPLGQLLERKAFLCPNFKCTDSSGCSASAQGSHKRVFHLHFKMAREGCNPGTQWSPMAVCRRFPKLGSQVPSLPAGAGGRCRGAEGV